MTELNKYYYSIEQGIFEVIRQLCSAITSKVSMVASCTLTDQPQLPLSEFAASFTLAYDPDDEDDIEDEDDDLEDLDEEDEDEDLLLDDEDESFDDEDDEDDDDDEESFDIGNDDD